MPNEYSAFGTKLAVGNNETPSEEFTEMAQVRDIDGPGMNMSTIEATHHQSASNMKEYVAGLVDGGEVTFEVVWDPADATHDDTTGFIYLLKNRLKRNWKLVTPVAASVGYWALAFAAFVTQFKTKEPVEGMLAADVTLKVTGAVTLEDFDSSTLC